MVKACFYGENTVKWYKKTNVLKWLVNCKRRGRESVHVSVCEREKYKRGEVSIFKGADTPNRKKINCSAKYT